MAMKINKAAAQGMTSGKMAGITASDASLTSVQNGLVKGEDKAGLDLTALGKVGIDPLAGAEKKDATPGETVAGSVDGAAAGADEVNAG